MKLDWKLTTDKGTFEGSTKLQNGVNNIVVDLPACRIEEATAMVMMPMTNAEKVFMNGYQTWTVSHEYDKNSRIRGLRGLPQRVIDQFALDRYGDYHFITIPEAKTQQTKIITHAFQIFNNLVFF